MNILRLKALLGAGCFSLALIGAAMHPAHAGGLERGGYDIDLLFDPSPVATEAEATYVMPDRKYKNARGPGGADLSPLGFSTTADGAEPYWVPRIGVKAQIVQGVDCMFDYSQPWGAHTAPGSTWSGAFSNIETDIKSNNYAGTCSYKFDIGKGQLRFIGGVFYQDIGGFKESLISLGGAVGRVDLDASGWGWRAGVAYEIPEIALRASLVYNSQVKLDNVSGTLTAPIFPTGSTPIYGSTQYMPDSVELKLQSGIAPGWLAFGSIKWVNWSVLQSVPICPTLFVPTSSCFTGSPGAVTSLDLMYRDGWTVSGGIGHKFNDQWSAAGQLSWDRGTSHGYGSQTDTWTLGGGVAYTPSPNVEIRLAGVIGVMTSGHSGTLAGENGYVAGTDASYDFGNDLITAINGGIKIKF
ncbi:transporter [Mesorhizobium sp. M2D.F.Ca.ET.185.01.1.1]|uniref:OmpP1/FadL family transporter n=1 Tax=unclassified Mesorhizobium TaxID=325217 RepID=UPI000FCBFCBA|nr:MULTISPECIES: OmpP1/FadL family transporter [unclassified Mesorhizobium]TGP79273.1 transporter [bacterium M00.F.Ca.ET.227.01.1.1]TGQ00990.1 transporter [bacterium M00.F.Ca.ET.221.01.1.1]TGQ02491.1 transporter [bacterium M00.F.Ca.ET.222.01.1.1]TGU12389.1 transporter [bacterium M00.F.Ca.ET.163.01.1.1]TGU34358.1 transporter [bacterium M00.F.Ca.ET.156.01.1.1]TGU46320.1 transporter [bacterium M00.F.Ca.ET.146.01.1.1]TGV72106.1 transporter [Mesorhizobium sp. M2D.F.Ca.ET.160.01.1.1]TGV75390.1 tr